MEIIQRIFICLIVCAGSMHGVIAQQLITYGDIPGRTPSDKYVCRVRMACSPDWQNAFVGQTYSQAPSQSGNGYISHLKDWSASWISFEFDNTEVVVEIAKADGTPILSAMTRPEGAASLALIENGKVYVSFNAHKNVNVDIDGQLEDQYTGMFYAGPPVHTISLFGNPIFKVPNTANNKVHYLQPGQTIPSDFSTWDTVYFAPGIHHIGTPFKIQSNKTLFIPRNAIVHGTIHPPDGWGAGHNWSVYGSGTISGEEIPHWSIGTLDGNLSKAFTGATYSAHLEGFVVVDPAHHTFNMINSDFEDTTKANIYKNLKILGWRLNSDGLNAFTNSEISDCFFRCQDDLFYYGGGKVKIRDCVTWADYNGHVVKIIWGGSSGGSSYFKNISSIYHRAGWHYWGGGRVVAFNDLEAGGNYQNIFISNVLVEDPHPSLPAFNFNITNPNNTAVPTIFENVVIEKVIQLHRGEPNSWGDATFGTPQNQMYGSDSTGMFSNIVFKNCYYDGKWLGSFDDGQFLTNAFVENIPFVLDDTLSVSPPAYTGWTPAFTPAIPAVPVIAPNKSVTICEGNSMVLTASEAPTYSWSTGATSPSITVQESGIYWVTVSNGLCSATSDSTMVALVNLSSFLVEPPETIANVEETVSFYATPNIPNATYQWQIDQGMGFTNIVDGAPFTGATNDTLRIADIELSFNNSQLRCIVTSGLCSDTAAAVLLLVLDVSSVSDQPSSSLLVYPNPARDVIFVKDIGGTKIYNTNGALVFESTEYIQRIDVSNWPAGLYFIWSTRGVGRFIKE